jgi:hypothetical protein
MTDDALNDYKNTGVYPERSRRDGKREVVSMLGNYYKFTRSTRSARSGQADPIWGPYASPAMRNYWSSVL